jgi:hypothetical protein
LSVSAHGAEKATQGRKSSNFSVLIINIYLMLLYFQARNQKRTPNQVKMMLNRAAHHFQWVKPIQLNQVEPQKQPMHHLTELLQLK